MSSNGEYPRELVKAMSDALSSDPDLLRFLNDIRWEFPDSRLLWVKVGGKEFGSPNGPQQPPTKFSVDILKEFEEKERQQELERKHREWIERDQKRSAKARAKRSK